MDEPSNDEQRYGGDRQRLWPAFTKKPYSQEEEAEARKGRQTWAALAIATLAFLATAYQGYVVRDQERRQLRAYVVPDGLSIETNGARSPEGSLMWNIGNQIKNSGQTPALAVKTVSLLTLIPRTIDTMDLSGLDKISFGSSQATIGAGAGAGGSFIAISGDAFVATAENRIRFMVAGKVAYHDIFSLNHMTKFCYFSIFPTGTDPNHYSRTRHPKGTVESCPVGNCTDDDCLGAPEIAALVPLGPVLPAPVESTEAPDGK